MENMEQQYKQAQINAQAAGAIIVENVMSCCRGCVDLKVPDGRPVAWSFAGQGNELVWSHGSPFFNPEDEEEDEGGDDEDGSYYGSFYQSRQQQPEPADGVYWYHEAGGGEIAATAFREAGFEVDWDGTDAKAVFVKF